MGEGARRFVLTIILVSSVGMAARQVSSQSQEAPDPKAAWPVLQQAMEKMHVGMRSIKPSGNNDVDFVRLMLPHHQAALDMATAELVYGNDPQLHRLAQEIVTDQRSEIELMQLWLKQHEAGSQK